MSTEEKSANGIRGFLLYNPFEKGYFFRVYDEKDRSKFEDYDLAAEDIEIQILDKHIVLRDGKLNYTKKVLGRDNPAT